MTIRQNSLRYAATMIGIAIVLTIVSIISMGALSVQAADNNQTEKTADVVVQFGDTDAIIRPITFTGEITGLKALELAGIDHVTKDYGWGIMICSIDGVGCPESQCDCGGSTYWGYNYWDGSVWQGYMVGASDSVISKTGSIEGYRWGE